MDSLKSIGVSAFSIGKVQGVLTWKLTGNTKPIYALLKGSGGFWMTNHWRLTDDQLKNVLKKLEDAPVESQAKRQKVDEIRELKHRKQEWEAIMTSKFADAYIFIMDKIFYLFMEKKGDRCWGAIDRASDAVHSCGLNIVWELFIAADKDMDKVLSKDHKRCHGCGELYT